jgi:hypothetical protein
VSRMIPLTYPIILIWSVAQSGMGGSHVAVWIRAFGELALQYCGTIEGGPS